MKAINFASDTSRDFCIIENVQQINLLAAAASFPRPQTGDGLGERVEGNPTNQVYNVTVSNRTTLNQLYGQLRPNLLTRYTHLKGVKTVCRDFRAGDVRHSLADTSKAATFLGYQLTHYIGEGLKVAMVGYVQHVKKSAILY